MRVFAAFIVTAALLGSGPVWADPPQGKGAKQKAKGHDERPTAASMRFAGLDLNGDRMITREEWRGSDASFRSNDWNRDGVLSGDEVQPNSRRPDQFLRKEWKGDLREFDKADLNHDGVLSAEEFARWH